MATVFDVALYILTQSPQKKIPSMKLQKLVYYCQAWSLVWDDKPIFRNKIEAWANGPVIPSLYKEHRLLFEVKTQNIKGDVSKLTACQKETIDAILDFYGDKSSQWLSDLTHMESPWQEAREGLSDRERGSREITTASMAEYYSSLRDHDSETETS